MAERAMRSTRRYWNLRYPRVTYWLEKLLLAPLREMGLTRLRRPSALLLEALTDDLIFLRETALNTYTLNAPKNAPDSLPDFLRNTNNPANSNAPQTRNTPVRADSQQALVLKRADVASSPLGEIGNLRYAADQGGTERASVAGLVFLSQVRNFLTNFVFNQEHSFDFLTNEKRALYEHLSEAHDNSSLVGNLLGCLTSPADDPKGQARIAKGLMELAKQSQGKLGDLKGGQESLNWYVKELTDSDIKALRDGVLSHRDSCKAVLDQISPESLRKQAAQVLVRIVRALDQRLAESFAQKHFEQIINLLSVTPVNAPELEKALGHLARDVDQFKASRRECMGLSGSYQLNYYLRSLPSEQSNQLKDQIRSDKHIAARHALQQIDDPRKREQALDMLNRIHICTILL